jgi:hypothetical protein
VTALSDIPIQGKMLIAAVGPRGVDIVRK